MSISQALCNSYKTEILKGLHQENHEFKIALFTSSAILNKNTESYLNASGEVSDGNGYQSGGKIISGLTVSLINDTAILDFTENPEWDSATFTAHGALIYNNSLSGKNAVCVLDFGEDFSCTNGVFTVTFPSPTESQALIRVV